MASFVLFCLFGFVFVFFFLMASGPIFQISRNFISVESCFGEYHEVATFKMALPIQKGIETSTGDYVVQIVAV